MKKNYLCSLAATVFTCYAVNAQFTDDFESYPLGAYHGGNWSSWSGASGGEDIIVSDNFAYDGTKSGLIAGGQVQDVFLGLGNLTSGTFQLSFHMYIPTGKSGYMSIQGTTAANGGAGASGAGIFNSPNLVFNNNLSSGGSPGTGGAYQNVSNAVALYTWQYPEESWFPVVIDFDLDNSLYIMNINGIALASRIFNVDGVLGALNFYSLSSNNEVYIDAITFEEATLTINDKELNSLKSYPNPVKDFLYLSTQAVVDMVEVYDILGHKILSVAPGTLSPKIDMSNLSSGTYLVKASIGNQIKTLKVLK